MTTYKRTGGDVIIRVADSMCIPCDEGNADYRAFLRWCAEGNEPEPYVPPAPVPRMLPKLEFLDFVVGVVGQPAWLAFRADQTLALLNDRLNLCAVVDPTDMPAFLTQVVARGHLNQAKADEVMALWPTA